MTSWSYQLLGNSIFSFLLWTSNQPLWHTFPVLNCPLFEIPRVLSVFQVRQFYLLESPGCNWAYGMDGWSKEEMKGLGWGVLRSNNWEIREWTAQRKNPWLRLERNSHTLLGALSSIGIMGYSPKYSFPTFTQADHYAYPHLPKLTSSVPHGFHWLIKLWYICYPFSPLLPPKLYPLHSFPTSPNPQECILSPVFESLIP